MNVGDRVGHRFVVHALGSLGGCGQIYRATDTATGQPVAIKVLLHPNAAERARFEREATLLAQLRHPAIVRYISHGHTPTGEPYLVMDWLEGEDLAERLLRGPLDLDDAVRLV